MESRALVPVAVAVVVVAVFVFLLLRQGSPLPGSCAAWTGGWTRGFPSGGRPRAGP